jgi:hypothetical protein
MEFHSPGVPAAAAAGRADSQGRRAAQEHPAKEIAAERPGRMRPHIAALVVVVRLLRERTETEAAATAARATHSATAIRTRAVAVAEQRPAAALALAV